MDQALKPPRVGPATAELERFPALTSLRFFAAGHVVLHHFLPPLSDKWRALKDVVAHGYVGVSFFYVLSGFVLAHAFWHRQPATPQTRRAFWWRRFARIYPA